MRSFKPKIKSRKKGKTLEWVFRNLSAPQKESLKNLYTIKTEGELMELVRFPKKMNKTLREACLLLRVTLKRNAFDENRSKVVGKKKGVGYHGERRGLKNGFGKYPKAFGQLFK